MEPEPENNQNPPSDTITAEELAELRAAQAKVAALELEIANLKAEGQQFTKTQETPVFAQYRVKTAIVHDAKVWQAGETVTLPQQTGDGLTATGDVEPVTDAL
jgi:hypothetical protein